MHNTYIVSAVCEGVGITQFSRYVCSLCSPTWDQVHLRKGVSVETNAIPVDPPLNKTFLIYMKMCFTENVLCKKGITLGTIYNAVSKIPVCAHVYTCV